MAPELQGVREGRDAVRTGPDVVTGYDRFRKSVVDVHDVLKRAFSGTPEKDDIQDITTTQMGGGRGALDAAVKPVRHELERLYDRGLYGYFVDFLDAMGATRQGDFPREHALTYGRLAHTAARPGIRSDYLRMARAAADGARAAARTA